MSNTLHSDDALIRNCFKSLLTVNVVSMLSVILCVLIDAAVTGKFLGTGAVTATGLLTPVVLLVSMLCSVIGSGLSTVCTRYMGMADIKRVNQAFSVVFYITIVISLVVSATLFVLAPAIAQALTPEVGDPSVAGHISDYLRGLALGRVFNAASYPLNGVMLLDNDRDRAVKAIFVTLIADVVLDYANVLVFRGGMFGMALATSVSGLLGFAVLMLHFRKKDRVVRFTREGLAFSDIRASFDAGFVTSITQIGNVLRGFFFNSLLLAVAGAGTVASLAVANNAFVVIMLLFVALMNTASTLLSMFFGEEDRSALGKTMKLAFRYTFLISLAVTALLLIFAKPVASVFLEKGAAQELAQAARFIRFMAVQNFFAAAAYPFAGGLLGTKRVGLNNLTSILREIVFPLSSALLFGNLFGLPGFEAGLAVTGVLVLAATILIPWIVNGKVPVSGDQFIILPPSFMDDQDGLFEASMKTMDEVILASEKAREHCLARGADRRTAAAFSLFVEEMAGNTVQHGFKGKKGESIDLRLIYRKDEQIIRLRDNGKLFDPIEWLERNHPEDPLKGAGIRIVIGMAKDVQYIPALRLNNLIVTV